MTTMTEAAVTTQVHRIYIQATPEAIWTAITDPAWTQRYGYGGRGEYELRSGGRYVAYTTPEMREHGAPDVAIDGEVLEADPPRKLVHTFRMVMDDAMAAQGFTRVTYEIAEINGRSRLTVTHELEGAPQLAELMAGDWEDRGAGGGWPFVLSSLKTLLETGESFTH
jgi:uncharacterized protein YndB with AHSA1/START domain